MCLLAETIVYIKFNEIFVLANVASEARHYE